MKKLNVLLLVSLLVLFALTGFSKETIKVISSDDFAAFRREVIPEFEKLYPDIEVELTSVGYNQLYQKEVTSLIANPKAYDVIDVDCIWTPEFVTLGLLEQIDDRLTPEMKEEIIPSVMTILQYNGKTYGLPMFDDVLFFYYNEKMLEEAGLSEPPTTYDEFVSFSKTIMDKGLAKYGSVWGWAQAEGLICYYTQLIGAFGGKFFDENGYPAFNSGGGLEALEWMVDSIYEYGVVDPSSITSDDRALLHGVANGDVPFGFDWSFAWTIFNDPEQSTQVGNIKVGLCPTGKEGIVSNTSSGSMGFAITKQSEHKDAAWKFISFLASKEMQKQQAIDYGAMPVVESLYSDPEILELHPEFGPMLSQLSYVTDRPSLVSYNEVSRILQIYIQRALTKDMEPKEALDAAAKEIVDLLKEYGEIN